MRLQPGFPDFFMSRVTGRIVISMFPDLTKNYVWLGNYNDRPLPSPIIIDLRLEIIDLRNRLSRTRFILQAPSPNFDSSQALNALIPGILKHLDGVVSIALPWVDYVPVDLPYMNIWIGDMDSVPQPHPRIFLDNLPSMLSADPALLLGAYNLYRGSPNPLTLGIPEIVKTLHITNMADLTEGHLWLGTNSSNPLNFGANRPVEIIILPLANMANLPYHKIWRGDVTNRPVAVDDLTDLEGRVTIIEEEIAPILELPYKNIWIGDISNVPQPFPRIQVGNLPTMLSSNADLLLGAYNLYSGNPDPSFLGQPQIVLVINIANMANLTEGSLWLGTNSTDPNNYGPNRPVETVILPLANMANLPFHKIWRGNISDRPVPVDDLTTLEGRVTINEGDISTLLSDVASILSSISSIISDISSIFSSIATITGEISVIDTTLLDLQSQIDVLNTTVLDLQSQIDSNVASGLSHLADLQLQIDNAISSGMSHLADINTAISTINTTLTSLQSQINTINTSITTINSTLTSLQSQINTINTSLSTINTTLTSLQSQINTINTTLTTIEGNITTIQGDITNITGVLLPAVYTYIDNSIANITNNFVAGGIVDMNGNRIKNLPCDPVEDNDAISFCFLWHVLHDEVNVLWS